MSTIDPVTLEILKNGFVSACEEAGITLKKTGRSPNIQGKGGLLLCAL